MPLTLTLAALILTVTGGITMILGKELFFSRMTRESATAYYAADTALECAKALDAMYTDSQGNGLFDSPLHTATDTLAYVNTVRYSQGIGTINFLDIRCASVSIFDSGVTDIFSTTTDKYGNYLTDPYGASSTKTYFTLPMNAGEGGGIVCAKVSVEKSNAWRQIIARGFNTCNFGARMLLERAVINTTEN